MHNGLNIYQATYMRPCFLPYHAQPTSLYSIASCGHNNIIMPEAATNPLSLQNYS